jgi:hypothetical protein
MVEQMKTEEDERFLRNAGGAKSEPSVGAGQESVSTEGSSAGRCNALRTLPATRSHPGLGCAAFNGAAALPHLAVAGSGDATTTGWECSQAGRHAPLHLVAPPSFSPAGETTDGVGATADPLGAVLVSLLVTLGTVSADLQVTCHNAFRRPRCKTCVAS